MSEIHIRRIRGVLTSKFDGLIDMADVQDRPEAERERYFLTRSLAHLLYAKLHRSRRTWLLLP